MMELGWGETFKTSIGLLSLTHFLQVYEVKERRKRKTSKDSWRLWPCC